MFNKRMAFANNTSKENKSTVACFTLIKNFILKYWCPIVLCPSFRLVRINYAQFRCKFSIHSGSV